MNDSIKESQHVTYAREVSSVIADAYTPEEQNHIIKEIITAVQINRRTRAAQHEYNVEEIETANRDLTHFLTQRQPVPVDQN